MYNMYMYYGIGTKMRVSKFVHSATAVWRQLRVINNNNINVMALYNNNNIYGEQDSTGGAFDHIYLLI